MDDQRLGVAHVCEVAEQLHRLDEPLPRRPPALDLEREHRARAFGQQLLAQRVIGMAGQLGVDDLRHCRMIAQELHDFARRLDVPRHAQVQRLDALQDLERGHRRHAGAEIAQAFAPCAQQEGARARLFLEIHVVEARVSLGQGAELAGGLPVEAP